jgi:thioredoxin-related protein
MLGIIKIEMNRRIILLLVITFITFVKLCATDTGIVFRPVEYSEIFKIAKEEKKAVLLYFYFDGCTACQKMTKEVFVEEEVASFYNEKFVCLKVNTKKAEGVEISKKYNIQPCPAFVYLDSSGKLLHKIVGLHNPHEFIVHAGNAFNSNNSLIGLKDQYKKGNREADFLYKYCYMLDAACELDSLTINEYLCTQPFANLSREKNIKFLYEFAIHNFKSSLSYNSEAFKFFLNHKSIFYNYFEKDQVITRIFWLLNSAAYEVVKSQDEILLNEFLEALRTFDSGQTYYELKDMSGNIIAKSEGVKNIELRYQLWYYTYSGELSKYNKVSDLYIEKIWNDYNELNSYALSVSENFEDNLILDRAVKCIKRSIQLNNNYSNNDTYATILFKQGKYDLALKQSEKAIGIAKKDNLDYKGTSDLIERINTVSTK